MSNPEEVQPARKKPAVAVAPPAKKPATRPKPHAVPAPEEKKATALAPIPAPAPAATLAVEPAERSSIIAHKSAETRYRKCQKQIKDSQAGFERKLDKVAKARANAVSAFVQRIGKLVAGGKAAIPAETESGKRTRRALAAAGRLRLVQEKLVPRLEQLIAACAGSPAERAKLVYEGWLNVRIFEEETKGIGQDEVELLTRARKDWTAGKEIVTELRGTNIFLQKAENVSCCDLNTHTMKLAKRYAQSLKKGAAPADRTAVLSELKREVEEHFDAVESRLMIRVAGAGKRAVRHILGLIQEGKADLGSLLHILSDLHYVASALRCAKCLICFTKAK